jgi:hypothetical protein
MFVIMTASLIVK